MTNKDNKPFAIASKLLRRRQRLNAGFRAEDQADETERRRLREEYFRRVSEVEESSVSEHPPFAVSVQRNS